MKMGDHVWKEAVLDFSVSVQEGSTAGATLDPLWII